MHKIFEIASRISTPLALAGIIVVVLFFIIREIIRKDIFSRLTRTYSFEIFKRVIDRLFILGLVSLFLGFVGYGINLVGPYLNRNSLYRVSISIIDSNNQPVTDAEVLSSPSGVQKRTNDGWEIDIPEVALANDKKLQVWAVREGGIFKGSNEILLAGDYNPSLTIVLRHDTSARIKGRVTDDNGNPLSEAVVYIASRFSEKATTDKSGLFDLPAHAAPGEHVHLFVEKENYQRWNDVIPAGGESLATIVLSKK